MNPKSLDQGTQRNVSEFDLPAGHLGREEFIWGIDLKLSHSILFESITDGHRHKYRVGRDVDYVLDDSSRLSRQFEPCRRVVRDEGARLKLLESSFSAGGGLRSAMNSPLGCQHGSPSLRIVVRRSITERHASCNRRARPR